MIRKDQTRHLRGEKPFFSQEPSIRNVAINATTLENGAKSQGQTEIDWESKQLMEAERDLRDNREFYGRLGFATSELLRLDKNRMDRDDSQLLEAHMLIGPDQIGFNKAQIGEHNPQEQVRSVESSNEMKATSSEGEFPNAVLLVFSVKDHGYEGERQVWLLRGRGDSR
ncbi:hypothetical protein U1Q18_037214 [Sarracenia purpurea var. burkii]